MANHPNRSRTYWYNSPRGFANEYTVGIASSKAHADQYAAWGYERISRDRALRELAYKGDAATKAYASVSVDGDHESYDRHDVARAIRTSEEIRRTYG
jgi:hypothetical protein